MIKKKKIIPWVNNIKITKKGNIIVPRRKGWY